MILLCGIPSEPSLGLVIEAVRELGAPHLVFHQRDFAATQMEFQIDGGGIHGRLQSHGLLYRLEDFTAVYARLMDYQRLPEIEQEQADSPIRFHCGALHDTLMRWYEIMPGRVLSRAGDIGVNYSKPYEAQLIHRQGFRVPDTLVTNDPDLARAFRLRHGRVIYKSLSYVRSIVKTLEEADLDRLGSIRSCPVQFQQYIEGCNVRVHTIGGHAFATCITAKATDYRYAYLEGEEERLEPMELPADLAEQCISLSHALGLGFAGIDLKITPGGEVYCLEVNPCPAFGYYQRHTGQPIAGSVARFLAGMA